MTDLIIIGFCVMIVSVLTFLSEKKIKIKKTPKVHRSIPKGEYHD